VYKRQYIYGAAVLNNYSTPDAVFKIAMRLGVITKEYDDIKNIECVLLGTGAGDLKNTVSIGALATGFEETAHPDARMIVYSWNSSIKKALFQRTVGFSRELRLGRIPV